MMKLCSVYIQKLKHNTRGGSDGFVGELLSVI